MTALAILDAEQLAAAMVSQLPSDADLKVQAALKEAVAKVESWYNDPSCLDPIEEPDQYDMLAPSEKAFLAAVMRI